MVVCGLAVFGLRLAPCARAQAGIEPDWRALSEERDERGLRNLNINSAAKSVTLRFALNSTHAVHVSGEYYRRASMSSSLAKALGIKPDWKFRAVPLTVSYVYTLPGAGGRFAPVAGVGLAWYGYKMTRRRDAAGAPALAPSAVSRFDRGYGFGYGAEATLGIRTTLTGNVFALTQLRYRYIKGFGVFPHKHLDTRLSVVDFVIGLGFAL